MLDPDGAAERFRLSEWTALGSDSSNHIHLNDRLISRFHCRIERTSGGVYKLIDLDTSSGTLINGKPVTQKLLHSGDQIQVGPFLLLFRGSRVSTMRLRTPGRRGSSKRRKGSGRKTKGQSASDSSSSDLGGWALEKELEEMLDNARDLFGEEGLNRMEAVFCEYSKARPESRFNQLESQKKRLLQLMEINQALTEELELGPLLEKILDSIVTLVDAEQAFVVMFDEDGRMNIPAHRNIEQEFLDQPQYEISRNLIEKVRESGQMMHCHDAQGNEEFDAYMSVSDLQLRSILCVPLGVGDTIDGVIYVENRLKPRAFDERDALVIQSFSHQASIAISNARKSQEILAKNRNLRTLNKMGKAISSTLELEPLLELIVGKMIEVSGANRTYLMLVNKDSDKLEFRLGRNQDNEPLTARDFEVSTSLVRKAVRRRRTMLTILDKANPSPSESLCADEFSAVMAVPMFVRDRLLGVIYADKDGHQQPFNRSQARLVEQFADQAKIAIHNAYLYMRATIDHMTRLYKRSYFDSRLEEELARSDRYDSPVTLLMLDLDHFKKLNDTHGHLAGDEVLRLIGHIIKTSVRGHDIAARYGGEEFSVIMPQLDLVGAVRVAKRIKRRIQHQSRLDHKLTISIGAAELQPGQTPEQLISKADRALYRAKKTGRNKVCTWRPGGSRRLLTSVKETKKKS